MSGRSTMLAAWSRWSKWPAGRRLFSGVVGIVVPYARTIAPQFLEIAPGSARVRMKDRRRVRNHLGSVHAAALFNLGELAANTALSAAQPSGTRWIVTDTSIVYVKKARGTLEGIAKLDPVDWSTSHEVVGESRIVDSGGDVVARLQVKWRVGPAASASAARAPSTP